MAYREGSSERHSCSPGELLHSQNSMAHSYPGNVKHRYILFFQIITPCQLRDKEAMNKSFTFQQSRRYQPSESHQTKLRIDYRDQLSSREWLARGFFFFNSPSRYKARLKSKKFLVITLAFYSRNFRQGIRYEEYQGCSPSDWRNCNRMCPKPFLDDIIPLD